MNGSARQKPRVLLDSLAQLLLRHHSEWTDDPRRLFQQLYPWLRWWGSPDRGGPDTCREIKEWIEREARQQSGVGRPWLRQVSRPLASPDVLQLGHPLVSRGFFVANSRRFVTVGQGTRIWDADRFLQPLSLPGEIGSSRVFIQSFVSRAGVFDSPSALSRKGWLAVVADVDGDDLLPQRCRRVAVYDINTAERLAEWEAGENPLRAMEWSPDSSLLATTSVDGSARLWSFPEAKLGQQLLQPSPGGGSWRDPEYPMPGFDWPSRPAFSPTGDTVAIGRETECHLWNVFTGEPLVSLEDPKKEAVLEGTRWRGNRGISVVSFCADGERLAIGMWDGTIRIWKYPIPFPHLLLHGPSRMVTDLAWHPDERRLVAAYAFGEVLLWTVEDPPCFRRLTQCRATPTSVSLSDDGGQAIVTEQEGLFHVCVTDDTESSRSHWRSSALSLEMDTIERPVAWSATGELACSGPGKEVLVLDRRSGEIVRSLILDHGEASALLYQPGEGRLCVGTTDGRLGFFDRDYGDPDWTDLRDPSEVRTLQFSGDGRTLLVHSTSGAVCLYDPISRTPWFPAEIKTASSAALSPDGSLLLCTTAGEHPAGGIAWTACIWHLREAGRPLWSRLLLPIAERIPFQVRFSPDGRRMWVGGGGVSVQFPGEAFLGELDIRTRQLEKGYKGVREMDAVRSLDIHPGGNLAAFATYGDALIVWSAAEHKIVWETSFRFLQRSSYGVVCWSPDGTRLAAGGAAGLSLWDLEGNQLAATPRKGIRGNLAWSSDGLTIGFIDGDGEPCIVWLENLEVKPARANGTARPAE